MAHGYVLQIEQFRSHGEEIVNLFHLRECRSLRLAHDTPLQNIQYASLDDLCRMGYPS